MIYKVSRLCYKISDMGMSSGKNTQNKLHFTINKRTNNIKCTQQIKKSMKCGCMWRKPTGRKTSRKLHTERTYDQENPGLSNHN